LQTNQKNPAQPIATISCRDPNLAENWRTRWSIASWFYW
jgi:hypothetical protein